MQSFFIFTLTFLFKLICINGNIITDQIDCLKVSLQDDCPNENVTFWLYNKNNINGHHLDEFNQTSFQTAPWIKDTKTVLILHGYTKNKSAEPNIWLRPKYIAKGYNVISADYPKAVPGPCYLQAVRAVNTLGKCTAHFIRNLTSKTVVTFKDLLVIGYSIGAHVAGKAGTYLKETKLDLERIVGLDPAFPLLVGPMNYITKSTAKFVMIIHTSMFTYGSPEMTGHADFIVNNGITQNNCTSNTSLTIGELITCNHDMAPIYYAESIDSEKLFCGKNVLLGKQVIMGEYTPEGARGTYFVKTNDYAPYAKDTTCGNKL